jgi:crotonobetainyl-CoA:carnitine CoA-transferase CaiB-like acyl-CoA transferase
MFVKVDVPGLDHQIKAWGTGFKFEHDGPYQSGHVPTLGEHTDDILTELGFDAAEISGFHSKNVV